VLATINRTGTIRLWDTATGKLVQSMNGERSEGLYQRLRFTSGEKTLVSTSMSYGEKAVASLDARSVA
jgi:WD40 repeat protein